MNLRLKRTRPLIDVEIDFIGKAARNAALAKFTLRLETSVRVKFVRITRKVGVVTDQLWFVLLTARSRTGND